MPALFSVWVAVWAVPNLLAVIYFASQLFMFIASRAASDVEQFTVSEGLDGLMTKVALPVIGALGGGLIGVAATYLISTTATQYERNLGLALVIVAFAFLTYAPVRLSIIGRRGTPKHVAAEIYRLKNYPGSREDTLTLQAELDRQILSEHGQNRTGFKLYLALLSVLAMLGFAWLIVAHFIPFNYDYILSRSSVAMALALLAGIFRRLWHKRYIQSLESFRPLIASLPTKQVARRADEMTSEPVSRTKGGFGTLLLGSGVTAAAIWVARRGRYQGDHPQR